MKGTALIVGATGAMGEEFSRLISKNYYTIGTTRRNQVTLCNKTIYVPDLSSFSCNIIINEIKNSYSNIDLILYNAGFAYNEEVITDKIRNEIFDVNANAVIEIYKSFPNSKFIYMSSCAVLGTSGTRNIETYVVSKRIAEHFLKHHCHDLVLVRPSVIPDTKFFERAKIEPYLKKGFLNSQQVAQYVVNHLHKKIILPGWQSKVLNFINKLSSKIAQWFLNI